MPRVGSASRTSRYYCSIPYWAGSPFIAWLCTSFIAPVRSEHVAYSGRLARLHGGGGPWGRTRNVALDRFQLSPLVFPPAASCEHRNLDLLTQRRLSIGGRAGDGIVYDRCDVSCDALPQARPQYLVQRLANLHRGLNHGCLQPSELPGVVLFVQHALGGQLLLRSVSKRIVNQSRCS